MAPTAVSAPGGYRQPIVDYAQGCAHLKAGITHRKVGAVLLSVWTAGVERSPERRTFSISHNKNRSIVHNEGYLHVPEWFTLLSFPPSTACRTYPAQPEFRGSFLLAAGPRQELGKKKRGGASFDGNKSKVTTISPFEYNSKLGDSAITYLQGIKGWDRPGTFLLVGANNSPGPTPLGFAYVGPLNSVANPAFNGSSGSGTWYPISVPTTFGAAGTSVYGPDKLAAGLVNYVGAYTRDLGGASPSSSNPSIVGFTYTGSVDGSTKGGYRKVQGRTYEGVDGTYTFVHSVDGGLAVGNTDLAALDGRTGYFSLKSTPFIVSLANGSQTPIRFASNDMDDSDFITHTAYGIWNNGNSSYTIAGGSGAVLEGGNGVTVGSGYLIDYDSITGQFAHYTEFNYQNRSSGDLVTHFEGIYRDVDGDYWLPATSVALNPQGDLAIASVVKVERSRSGGFQARAEWRPLTVRESATGVESVLSTGNSLFGNTIVGFANYPTSSNGVTQADFVIHGNWLPQSFL